MFSTDSALPPPPRAAAFGTSPMLRTGEENHERARWLSSPVDSGLLPGDMEEGDRNPGLEPGAAVEGAESAKPRGTR
jgi:hypothetical protein